MRVRFGPEDAFGLPSPVRTTAKRASPATLQWDSNEGVSSWVGELIGELQATEALDGLSANWNGNLLTLSLVVDSQQTVDEIVASSAQVLPAFLSFRLRVFVWIKEFLYEVGDCAFRSQIPSHRYAITVADKGDNEMGALAAVRDWASLRRENLRFLVALYYLRHARRIAAVEPDRTSMTAEVVINLAKAIEILFSSDRDRLRSRAREWELNDDFVERRIVPILLIRSHLDVAHPTSTPLPDSDRQAVLDFVDRALTHVHQLLAQVLAGIQSGAVVLDPVSERIDRDKRRLLESIAEYAKSD